MRIKRFHGTNNMSSTYSGDSEYSYRIVLLGDYSVGKSSIALQYVKNQFNDNEESTIGAAFLTKTIRRGKNYIKYEIWDTAGQERYNSLMPMYYRGAQAALVVYDITSLKSFERSRAWIKELDIEKPADFVKILVGNKADLEKDRAVLSEKALEYAKQHNTSFYEASAKNGTNIENIFNELSETLPGKITDDRPDVFHIGKGKGAFGCC